MNIKYYLIIYLSIIVPVCIAIYILSSVQASDIKVHGQIFSKENNIQSTNPNNKTSMMIIFNHGESNFTISDIMPTMMSSKCPITGHLIDNNNLSSEVGSLSSTLTTKAKPIIMCYI